MSIINCQECNKEISDKATACPHCGCPLSVVENHLLQSEVKPIAANPPPFNVTNVIGPIQIDKLNKQFKIKGKVQNVGKKNGLGKSLAKGYFAVATLGMSTILSSKKNEKVGTKEIFNFSDLLSYELLEDDSLITSGGVGQALIGGAIFGIGGAIAGGITAKRVQKKQVESLAIKVTLNSFDSPCILIPLISSTTKTKSSDYQKAIKSAYDILSALDVIAHNTN